MTRRTTARTLVGSTLLVAALLGGCGGDDGDVEAFCADLASVGQLDAVFDTFDPSDVEGTTAQFTEALGAYEGLRANAPSEVGDDLDVLIDFTTEFRDQLTAGDPDDPATTTEVGLDLEERFADVEAATRALDTFVAANCPGS